MIFDKWGQLNVHRNLSSVSSTATGLITIFLQSDAAAANYSIPLEREATIQERPLNGGAIDY